MRISKKKKNTRAEKVAKQKFNFAFVTHTHEQWKIEPFVTKNCAMGNN